MKGSEVFLVDSTCTRKLQMINGYKERKSFDKNGFYKAENMCFDILRNREESNSSFDYCAKRSNCCFFHNDEFIPFLKEENLNIHGFAPVYFSVGLTMH